MSIGQARLRFDCYFVSISARARVVIVCQTVVFAPIRLMALTGGGMMAGSKSNMGALLNSQPPTPGRLVAAGDATKVVLIDMDYKAKHITQA
jgi:hypothetical protein